MSWSLTTSPIPPDEIRDAVVGSFRDDPRWPGEPEVRDQLAVAIEAAEQLVIAVGDGRPQGLITVSVSGHANPGHEPTSGLANDFVTVTVANASQ